MHHQAKWDLKHTYTHSHTQTHRSWRPSNCTFELGAVCGGALLREQLMEASDSRRLTGSQINQLLQRLSLGRIYQVYSAGQRGTFLPNITLNPLSHPPACSEDVIFQGPRWKTEPSDLILPSNTPEQRATITCEAEGHPPPQYR